MTSTGDDSGALIAGKYRIVSALGRGAMGRVDRAEQLDAEGRPLRMVALKTIQPELGENTEFAQRFLREVRVAARLQSPHAVTVFDAGRSDDGRLYFAMELVEGPSLGAILQAKGAFDPALAAMIGAQIADALADAHELDPPVVHRDLKPANVFVTVRDDAPWAKVGDFGIAKILGEDTGGLTQTPTSPGTPRYMAPEMWRGEELDGRADLYALGVLLYELLTGELPFAGPGLEQLMYQHLNEEPPELPPGCGEELSGILRELLRKRPEDRPATAREVRDRLRAAQGSAVDRDAATQAETPDVEAAAATRVLSGGDPLETTPSGAVAAAPASRSGWVLLLVFSVIGAAGLAGVAMQAGHSWSDGSLVATAAQLREAGQPREAFALLEARLDPGATSRRVKAAAVETAEAVVADLRQAGEAPRALDWLREAIDRHPQLEPLRSEIPLLDAEATAAAIRAGSADPDAVSAVRALFVRHPQHARAARAAADALTGSDEPYLAIDLHAKALEWGGDVDDPPRVAAIAALSRYAWSSFLGRRARDIMRGHYAEAFKEWALQAMETSASGRVVENAWQVLREDEHPLTADPYYAAVVEMVDGFEDETAADASLELFSSQTDPARRARILELHRWVLEPKGVRGWSWTNKALVARNLAELEAADAE